MKTIYSKLAELYALGAFFLFDFLIRGIVAALAIAVKTCMSMVFIFSSRMHPAIVRKATMLLRILMNA